MYSRTDIDAMFPSGSSTAHFAHELAVNILKTCPEHTKRDALIDAVAAVLDQVLASSTWAASPAADAPPASLAEAPAKPGLFARAPRKKH